ncbi:MAG: hypothetical protein GC164_01885 [Phycisphaera sp.]|nr:hypothetical protein [Phycisphaera sp.]
MAVTAQPTMVIFTLALNEAPPLWTSVVLILGLVLVTVSLMLRIRKKQREAGQRHRDLDPHERVERYRQESGTKADLEQLMVEIEQFAKRLGTQLDAKAMRLEKLIEEADRRIAQLDAPPESPEPPDAPSIKPAMASPVPSPDPLTTKVYSLADEGLAPIDIARKVDEHVGKVELILALRQA